MASRTVIVPLGLATSSLLEMRCSIPNLPMRARPVQSAEPVHELYLDYTQTKPTSTRSEVRCQPRRKRGVGGLLHASRLSHAQRSRARSDPAEVYSLSPVRVAPLQVT